MGQTIKALMHPFYSTWQQDIQGAKELLYRRPISYTVKQTNNKKPQMFGADTYALNSYLISILTIYLDFLIQFQC